MATLLVANPNGAPCRLALPASGLLKVGRKSSNDVVIDDPHVSSHHAEIRYDEEQQGYFIKDLDSHNGTRVNGEKITAEVTFKEGDTIVFGILESTVLPDKEVRSLSPKRLAPPVREHEDHPVFEPTQMLASMLENRHGADAFNGSSALQKINGANGDRAENANGTETAVPHQEETNRDDVVCKEVIKRLDLIDDLLERYRFIKKDEEVVSDLTLVKQSFQDMLQRFQVEAYSFDPETEINMEMRKKIKVVETVKAPKEAMGADSTNRIIQTLHEGYMRRLEGSNPVILRKAHVTTRTQLAH